ncbi:hypothetical protein KIW84_033507 [Lathyrus oleraceus]|uniref:ABC transporter domain-containing protein n=1 Tax=Pisum sativum TaxID=3888 RepID=A0A9D5B3V4_PEA|nr:hypothetical protein KIW84_033507 [Pisum sativum]
MLRLLPTVLQSQNQKSKGENPDLQTLFRRFLKVVAPYWSSDDKVQARLQLASVFILTLATTGISVGFSFLGRDFYNALARSRAIYEATTLLLGWLCWGNPDQQIVDYLSSFTGTTLSFSLTLFNVAVDLISFSNILYGIYPPQEKHETLLEIENLILKTPSESTLIRDLSLTIKQKDNLLITGPNGSGKTSLLKAMAGLWKTETGKNYEPMQSCFDDFDELMEQIKKTYGILGLNQTYHNLCFTWVLFHRFVATGQMDLEFLSNADGHLAEVAKDEKTTKDSEYSKILSSTLTSILGWAKKSI